METHPKTSYDVTCNSFMEWHLQFAIVCITTISNLIYQKVVQVKVPVVQYRRICVCNFITIMRSFTSKLNCVVDNVC